VREIHEELGVGVQVGELVGDVVHNYPRKKIHLYAYLCRADSWDFTLTDHDDFKWVDDQTIGNHPLSAADRPLVASIFTRLNSQGSK
jgi:8-oxo-dGTP diphosphatase